VSWILLLSCQASALYEAGSAVSSIQPLINPLKTLVNLLRPVEIVTPLGQLRCPVWGTNGAWLKSVGAALRVPSYAAPPLGRQFRGRPLAGSCENQLLAMLLGSRPSTTGPPLCGRVGRSGSIILGFGRLASAPFKND